MDNHEYAVIMAGGIGSRFWPVSRSGFPKQFLDILNLGETLIQSTYKRFKKFIPEENIYVITNEKYVDLVRSQLPGLVSENLIPETSRKNTAPCIAYASYKIRKKDKFARIICTPSDHLIVDPDNFAQTCLEGLDFVRNKEALLTIGLKPTRPETGYGYIQYDTEKVTNRIHKVRTFTEKPNLELATTFIESGDFLWNGGIFIWHVEAIINAFKKYHPELNELFEHTYSRLNTPGETEAVGIAYSQCTNISIDYAILEKAENVFVIPADFEWSDMGTWKSAYINLERDYLENAVLGKNVRVIDASRCMIKAPDEKMVILQGLEDFIVVDTTDVLLICKKEKEQDIKKYIAEIKRSKGERFL